MPHPKKKQSNARSKKRRSAWAGKLLAAGLVPCPKCKTPKRPHQACHTCGTYKGEQVLKIEHKPTRSERRAALKAAAEKEKKAAKESNKAKE